MNIQLNPELEAYANAIVHTGRYESVDAVVAEGMRLVQIREQKLASLRAEIQAGIADIESGNFYTSEEVDEFLEERFAQLRAQGYK